jgi:hypothetical protein
VTETKRGSIFRKRNILGLALAAGIGVGIYLGQFKGFGLGGGSGSGFGTGDGKTQTSIGTEPSQNSQIKLVNRESEPESTFTVPKVVRVVVDGYDYLLRTSKDSSSDQKISLPKLIDLIQQAPGDDGLKVRIYRTTNARASAEEKLKDELNSAGIDDAEVFWVPTPVK